MFLSMEYVGYMFFETYLRGVRHETPSLGDGGVFRRADSDIMELLNGDDVSYGDTSHWKQHIYSVVVSLKFQGDSTMEKKYLSATTENFDIILAYEPTVQSKWTRKTAINFGSVTLSRITKVADSTFITSHCAAVHLRWSRKKLESHFSIHISSKRINQFKKQYFWRMDRNYNVHTYWYFRSRSLIELLFPLPFWHGLNFVYHDGKKSIYQFLNP